MKKGKLRKILERNAWLVPHLVGYSRRHGDRSVDPEKHLEDWARKSVTYIAFRPWESLPLQDRHYAQEESLGIRSVVSYDVLWHLESQEPASQNGIDLLGKEPLGFTPTVEEILKRIVEKRLAERTHRDPTVCISAVIKRSFNYSRHLRHSTGEAIEIFRCFPNDVSDFINSRGYDSHIRAVA